MWRLHRYYLKEVTVSSLLTFMVLFGIVLISVVYRAIDRAQGFGLLEAAKTTVFYAADTIPHLLAIALLFSTVLTFARASQDREITAIRSAGISPRVALASPMLVGILASILAGWAFHYVIPMAHFNKYRVVADNIRQVMLNTGLFEGAMRFDGKGLLLYPKRTNEKGEFEDVAIRLNSKSPLSALEQGGLYEAEIARLVVDSGQEQLVLQVEEIRDVITGARPPDFEFSVDLRELLAGGSRRGEDERDITSDQLLAEVYRGVHHNEGLARYTVHKRGCFALMPCLFAPLGFCIGVLARDRGRIFALVLSLVPLLVFYFVDFMGAKLVRNLDMPILAWLPAMVTAAIGFPFCWRLLRF